MLECAGRTGPNWSCCSLPYPDTDSGDVVGTDSSDGLLSSLMVGGGWDMPEAGADGEVVEDSGAAVEEASGGTEVPGLFLACHTQKKGSRHQYPYQASTSSHLLVPPYSRLISPGHTVSCQLPR